MESTCHPIVDVSNSLLPCNHLLLEWIVVIFATDSQSASTSWCRTVLWGPWPDFICSLVWHVLASSFREPSLTRGRVCILQCTSLPGQSREAPITIHYVPFETGFPFRRPLRLVGLRWKYSNPPPHGQTRFHTEVTGIYNSDAELYCWRIKGLYGSVSFPVV
jgi:hypothetical protein